MTKYFRIKPKPLKRFDFTLVQPQMKGLLINVDRDIHRQVRQAEQRNDLQAARQFVVMRMIQRVAMNAYQAVIYLGAETPEDPNRKPTYILVVPPINRQLLDLLFTLVYILDDYPARLIQYERAGWREAREEYLRFWQRYATDPEWKDFFRNRKKILASLASKYGVSEKEQKKEKLIPYWHTPSKLMEQRTKSKSFLRWLYKWFYQDTSEQAHLSNSGIFVVAPFLLADVVGGEDQEITEAHAMKQYHYLHVSRTCIVTLAIATEISTFFNLDNNSQLAYLWTMFSEHVPEGKDMYEQRYRGLLH